MLGGEVVYDPPSGVNVVEYSTDGEAIQDLALGDGVRLDAVMSAQPTIQNAIDEASLEVIPMVTKRTNALPSIANVATLMGLLGTIIGMIMAFAAVANAAPDQKATLLTNSIAIAMNTTAFGLIVAIPCMLAHLFLSNVTKKILDEIDQYSVKLQNLLVARAKGKLK